MLHRGIDHGVRDVKRRGYTPRQRAFFPVQEGHSSPLSMLRASFWDDSPSRWLSVQGSWSSAVILSARKLAVLVLTRDE